MKKSIGKISKVKVRWYFSAIFSVHQLTSDVYKESTRRSTISHGGVKTSGGVPNYHLAIFCQELHENE